ncbi:MAG: class I SAM-dependent methyltransferase [Pseudomonadota bacterium]
MSIAANEFIWEKGGETTSNNLVKEPILRLLRRYTPVKLLDLGCGNGALTTAIHTHGFDVAGCDYSTSGIALAQRQYSNHNINFFQHDLQHPLANAHVNQYDTVISSEVIEHLLLPRTLMSNAYSALKPGGKFILTTPYHGYCKNLALALSGHFDKHWHPLRDYGHIKFFSKSTITQLFEEHCFDVIHFETLGRFPAFARSMLVCGQKRA